MKQIRYEHIRERGFHEGLQRELSTFPEKTVHDDGSVTIERISNPYFLVNDQWNVGFFGEIKQFEELLVKYKAPSKNFNFTLNNPSINIEVKYVFYRQLFDDLWAINSVFTALKTPLYRMAEFLNEKYPNLVSLLDLDIEEAEREYWFWLNEKGSKTHIYIKNWADYERYAKTSVASFLRRVYNLLFQYTDEREEWEKDRWDVRILHNRYGVDYNKSTTEYYLDFSRIENKIRGYIKKYVKQRILSKNNFSWSSAQRYRRCLQKFITFIFSLEPTWTNLQHLKRTHIERYIEHLHEHSKNNLNRRDSHPEHYVKDSLSTLQKFLEDIQRYDYEMAPETHVRLLIFQEDMPKLRKKSIDQIDYIPDFVLEQLFSHIDDLHEDVIPVVWVAFKTGLRISDVLGLTSDCLVKLNGQYSIVTDIEKTYVKGHRIPVDEELAGILAVLIKNSKKHSNQDNNPDRYIFVRYRGQRKGKPFRQRFIREELNILAKKKISQMKVAICFILKPTNFDILMG